MPWCPKCKTEYQEGIEKCADCGSDLVDELPEEEAAISEEELAEAEESAAEEVVIGEDGEEINLDDLS